MMFRKFYFLGGLILLCFVIGLTKVKAADLEIILGSSSAFNVVRGSSVAGGTSTLYVGSTTVSIGTTTQSAMLYVAGSSSANTDASLHVMNTSGTNTLYVRNDGRVGVGTTTPGTTLYVIGTITATTGFSGDGSALTGVASTPGASSVGSAQIADGSISTADLSGTISVSTTGTINAGSTTVTTLTTTGSSTVTGTLTAAGGSFTVNGNTGSMTATVVNAGTGNITTLSATNATVGSLTATTLTANGSITASSLALTGTLTAAATGGRVGIGTTTPATLFTVGTTTNILNITDTGTVGVGTTTPGTALYVIGTITATGEIISRNNGLVVKLEPPPMGEIYFTNNGTSTATQAAGVGVYIKVAGTTTFNTDSMYFGTSNTNNRLIYTGTSTKVFHVAMTASYVCSVTNRVVSLAIAKNGTTTGMEKSIIKDLVSSTSDAESTAIHVMPKLIPNDYLEVFVANLTGTGDVTVQTLNMFAMGMSQGND